MSDDVRLFLERVSPAERAQDGATLLRLMQEITGQEPALRGSIVGFGSYHYRYPSGREGDSPAAAFAPRKSAIAVYLMDGVGAYVDQLARLGPHTTGVGCLYIKDLSQIDLDVLTEIIRTSYANLTAGTFTDRARESLEEA